MSTSLHERLLRFLDASPTPYHAVAVCARRLEAAGFARLREEDPWELAPGAAAFTVRGDASLAAFRLGSAPPADAGFRLIGAHTDSPNLRVKPVADVTRHGARQLGVEVYGSPLLHTWLDRDLSLAGRVVVDAGGELASHLVDFQRPILRVPSLAIHLNRTINTDGLKLNPQTHLVPMLGLEKAPALPELLAAELRAGGTVVEPAAIVGHDLCLYDVAGATVIGGGDDGGELISSARLDNLASCFGALEALLDAPTDAAPTRAIVLYDHEEVGSESAQGAGSPFLADLLRRLADVEGARADALPRAIARSFLVSADMAHAVHPNYADLHEPAHQVRLGQGPVVKVNVNQRYATDGESMARFRKLCRDADVPSQSYVVRSDMPCGSTIGPITAARLGLRTVDVGNPMLAMHSIRETAAVADVPLMQRALAAHFRPS